jgi:NAD(P)-dependent dehydrogenase (short-subunit alcohol dehydrogenase family)
MSGVFTADALKGKTAFVAGGTSGINLGIATRYAELGANLVLLGRNPERLESAMASVRPLGGQVLGIAGDVRDYEAIDQAFAQAEAALGPIDIVISGAAGNFLAPVIGLSAKGFRTVVEIDLIGTFNVFRAAWAHLRKPASLIAITAGQAVHPLPFQAHACAAKAGVNMLVKCLALEWGPAEVRVNAISPGPIAGTEGMARLAASPEVEIAIKSRLALRDYGSTLDIAEMAVFLATGASRYVTGAIFNVDGGNDLGDASADALTLPARG